MTDPFLLDNEQIEALAEPHLIRLGLQHSIDKRVTALDRQETGLWAEVEDAATGDKLQVDIRLQADGRLRHVCACPESMSGDANLCIHAIAALFTYAREEGGDNGQNLLDDAVQAAIAERISKARAEVKVEAQSDSARDTGYGRWLARSVQSSTHFPSEYRIHIRSLQRRANYCSCPDFAANELGTCKHIEAVLHRLRKRDDFKQLLTQAPPQLSVYLDWEAEAAPVIRLQLGAVRDADMERIVLDHFDADGRFRLRIPDDFLRFANLVAHRGDIDLGEDALGYARRLAEDAARATRAKEIGQQIRAGSDRLPGIRAKLYPYQVEGIAFLAGRGRALLADDMGLGKTLQAIAAGYWLHKHDGVERILVICPASLKLQWAREIEKFTGEPVQIIQGPVDARSVQYRGQRGFHVVNYELAVRDLSVINSDFRPDLVILDEAQRIKNWRTKVASGIKRIGSRYAFVLTGTPLENRLEDLYSLMQVVDPRVLGPLWRYLVDFHITNEQGKVLGYRNLSELRRRLLPVMLRRDRALVRDQLPERTVMRIDVPLSLAQQGIHDEAIQAASLLAQIMKRRPLTPSEQNRMMAALQRARMACNAAGLVDPVMRETPGDSAPKLDELETLLEELCLSSGQKAVIFSQWTQMTEMAEERARRLGLGCVRLHGGVPSARRGELIDRFREDDAVQVFISTDAGGVGLNLQNAAVLINLDIPWNPAVLDQRIARVHRLGQRQKVQAILLVAPESYEEQVLNLVEGKRNLFENVVDPEATEDVVGVSRRLAEVLAEELVAQAEPDVLPPDKTEQTKTAEQPTGPKEDFLEPRLAQGSEDARREELVRQCVIRLQALFGPRILRVLGQYRHQPEQGSRGANGLLVILDEVSAADDVAIEELGREIPIALMDHRTQLSLSRLGAASPIADAQPILESKVTETANEHPLARKARSHIEAAELLIQQGCPGPALELLLGALLAVAAWRAGNAEPPTLREAGVWIYGEALPAQALNADDAMLLMRAIALHQAGNKVPEPMLQELASDASAFLEKSSQ